MKRIALSKREKHVLRTLAARGFDALSDADQMVVGELERLGLVRGLWVSGHTLESAMLTNLGKEYLFVNPKLRNPINWAAVAAAGAWLTALVSILALIMACA